MSSYWRRLAAPIIARVLAETEGMPATERRAALRAAYPFGVRRYHPYRIWCDEVRAQTGRKKKPSPRRQGERSNELQMSLLEG